MKNELNYFIHADGITDAFKYDLTLLEEAELITTIETQKQKESDNKYQKQVSKGLTETPCKIAGANIGQFYTEQSFSDDNSKIKGMDATTIANALEAQEALLAKGDLTSLENMLLSQSHTLNTIFADMVFKMAGAKYLKNLEVYGRIALKAQNQTRQDKTRQTASTLTEIKGIKKTTFIHQLNQGINQQVNNGAGENLNDSANERVSYVDTTSKTRGTRQDKPDEALAIQDTRGEQTLCNELLQARDAISQDDRTGETVSPNKQTGKGSKKVG